MAIDIDTLLSSYPRARPELPAAQQAIYDQEYKDNRQGRSLIQRAAQAAESWMHHQVASQKRADATILEIGAGTLNHVPYETFKKFDIIEPFTFLFEDAEERKQVDDIYADISEVPLEPAYDRVISVAVLEHLDALPFNVARSGLLLKKNGVFQAGIPSEGGFLWGAAWRMTTGLSYRLRTGLSYAALLRHEHLNTSPEIIAVVRYFFRDVIVRRFPLPFHHGSLYAYVEAREPIIERCRTYGEQAGG